MITKYLKKTSCESAEKVASIDDLIVEILLNLPVSSLLRFKFVSKHWLSLITSPHFSRLHILRRPLRVRPSGLLIKIDETHTQNKTHTQYKYIPLDNSGPFHTVTFPTSCDPVGLTILQSCNGLLFCSNSALHSCKHYVYNPTTRHFTVIPLPPSLTNYTLSYSTTLAFDPSISPHYKLVSADHCVGGQIRKIMIYSSETKVWSVCGDDQPANSMNLHKTNFSNGVYLNGAVHWMSFSPTTIYLKIDEERLETMPMPPILNSIYMYFGASGDRLHLITANYHLYNASGPVFDVYEMAKECSKWCLRYQVDLREVCWDISRIEIKGIVRGETEDDSFLLFNAPLNDEFITVNIYKLADKTVKTLFRTKVPRNFIHSIFGRSKAYEFIQSLSYV